MARYSVKNGHTVTMVCGSYDLSATGLTDPFERGKREGVVEGIRIIEFDLSYSNADGLLKRTWLFLKFAASSSNIALRTKYDVLFATTTPLTAGIPGILARWFCGKPFVFEVRDLWPELPKAMKVITNPIVLWAMSILEFISYRSAHRCVALSPGISDGIEKRGVPHDRIRMVSNGCDLEIFAKGDISPQRPDGVEPGDLLALFAGTHGEANGLDAVLHTAAVLKSRNRNDIKFVLVGGGKLKPALQKRAAEEGLGNVLFLDPMDKANLAQLMAGSDIGLQCLANIPAFQYGTSPNKFFDYIAAGLPVVNNYPGWVADMITEQKCGYVVPPDDPDAFADTLETAQMEKVELATKGERGLELARQKFDRAKLAQKWLEWVSGAAVK